MTSLLRRVKSDMAIFAHRKARGMLDGEYGSVFRGRSLDFDDLRAYIPGDEVRDIDWKASARHGSPLIRRYVAVRRQTVILVTDTGRNMAAAARSGETKKDIAVMGLGVMGYLAQRHGDVVGLVAGDSGGTTALPAKGGEPHLERLLRQVDSAATLDAAPSRIEDQLEHVARTIKGRNLLFVVADEVAASPATSQLLRRLDTRNVVVTPEGELADAPTLPGFEVTPRPNGAFAVTYRTGESSVEQVLAAVRKAGVAIRDIATEDPDLEDVFLALTYGDADQPDPTRD